MEELRTETVLDLKRRAKESKLAEDKEEALEWLKQAKELQETQNLSLQLKKLAIYFKQQGKLDEAKDALIKSKQVENQEQALLQEKEMNAISTSSVTNQKEFTDLVNANEEGEELSATGGGVTFTDDEMMDEEIIMEFQSCGMEVPSQQSYSQRILKYKRQALALKQKGDIAGATSALRTAKQFQKVQAALQRGENSAEKGGGDDWMKNLTAEESELLGELMTGTGDSLGGELDIQQQATQKLDLEDLETMDDNDIKEFLGMGVKLPSVNELSEAAMEKQAKALKYKQSGNLEMAKAMLVESKKIKLQAERLDRIYETLENNDHNDIKKEIHPDDLQALLASSTDESTEEKQLLKKKEVRLKDPWLSKPSEEIKGEVIRLKDAKNVTEATRLLQIYKQVLKEETDAKEVETCRRMLGAIQQQVEACEKQIKLFTFFCRFVDSTVGSEQLLHWKEYTQQCLRASKVIKTEGSKAVKLSTDTESGLQCLPDDIVEFIESSSFSSSSSLNGSLEVSVLQCLELHKNKAMQKYISKQQPQKGQTTKMKWCPELEVDVKLQLPTSEGSQHVHLMFDSSESTSSKHSSDGTFEYRFENAQSIPIPRGDTRQAKTIIRRMETKKVQINVSVKPPADKKSEEKSSWFFPRGKSEPSEEKNNGGRHHQHLGKVTLELKDLLTRNCIAGDYPLQINSKDVGGVLRLCLRTDKPFDIDRFEGKVPITTSPKDVYVTAYPNAMSFTELNNKGEE